MSSDLLKLRDKMFNLWVQQLISGPEYEDMKELIQDEILARSVYPEAGSRWIERRKPKDDKEPSTGVVLSYFTRGKVILDFGDNTCMELNLKKFHTMFKSLTEQAGRLTL